MSGSTSRLQAISAVTNFKPITPAYNFAETSTNDLFGANVFSLKVMEKVLPKQVFKSLRKTIETGATLDASMADVVATAMKDWAIAKGATHYAHVFLSSDRPLGRKARQLPLARWPGRRDRRVLRQDADPR